MKSFIYPLLIVAAFAAGCIVTNVYNQVTIDNQADIIEESIELHIRSAIALQRSNELLKRCYGSSAPRYAHMYN